MPGKRRVNYSARSAFWPCGDCRGNCTANSVQCDACNSWYHYSCQQLELHDIEYIIRPDASFTCSNCYLVEIGQFNFDSSLFRLRLASLKGYQALRYTARREMQVMPEFNMPSVEPDLQTRPVDAVSVRMPRKKENIYSQYIYTNLENAVSSVKSGEMSIRKAALHFKIPKSTIYDHVSGRIEDGANIGRPPTLPSNIENNIVNMAMDASEKGFGISRKLLQAKTGQLVRTLKIPNNFKNGIPGNMWWRGLKSRYPDLRLRRPEKLSTVRSRMMNRPVVYKYFESLESVLKELNIDDPSHIWNCDEKGFQMEHTPVAVCARKGIRSLPGRTSNSRESITCLVSVNANGDKMPPLCIVKGKTRRSLDSFKTEDAPQGTAWCYQPKAWMCDVLGLEWFKNVFLKHCGAHRPQLLLLDSHSSHEVLGLLQLAREENIHILALPPHTTHWLQPLDRAVFAPLSNAYDTACSELLSDSPLNCITKSTWCQVFKTAWDTAVTPKNIKSGFKACGIFPLNKNAIPPEAFKTEPFEVPDMPTTSNSASTDDPQQSTSSDTSVLAELAIKPIDINDLPEGTNVAPVSVEELLDLSSVLVPDCNDATADDNVVSVYPNINVNIEIENIFSPKKNSSNSSTKNNKRKITSHRLLTSDEIIEEKKREVVEKEKKMKEKEIRMKKREESKMPREGKRVKEKRIKATRKEQVLCCVCMLEDDGNESENIEWVQCDKCTAWVHFLCIPHRIRGMLNPTDIQSSNFQFFCPKCQWLTN